MTFGGAINSVRNSASGRRRFPMGERLVRGVGVPSAPGSPLGAVTSPPPRQPRRPAHFTLRLCLLCLSLSNFSGWRTRGPPERASCPGDGPHACRVPWDPQTLSPPCRQQPHISLRNGARSAPWHSPSYAAQPKCSACPPAPQAAVLRGLPGTPPSLLVLESRFNLSS